MSSLSFRKFSPRDTPQIVNLLKIFKVPITIEEWEWFVLKNPDGQSRVYIAYTNENNIVGVCGYFPVLIKVGKESYKGGYGHHLMLSTEFRDTVSYIQFSNYQIKCEKEFGTEWFIGPPNPSSYKPHKILMKWQDFGYLDYMYKSNPKKCEHNCKRINSFTNEFDEFYNLISQKLSFHLDKSTKRMNWRFFNSPNRPYETYMYYDNNKLYGYIVLKRWKEFDGSETMHIIDMHALSDKAANELLITAESVSAGCKKIDMWAVQTYAYMKYIEDFGFTAAQDGRRPLAIKVLDGTKQNYPDGLASFMFGDGDQY